jgi:chemotaxis protein MotB
MSNQAVKIIRKKHHEEEHQQHGGAWKIAFADFMTALMAYFFLLWILGTMDDDQRRGVADYFQGQKPSVIEGSPMVLLPPSPKAQEIAINDLGKGKDSLIDLEFAKQKFVDSINKAQENSVIKNQVIAEATPDGVLITLLDKTGKPMFLNGDDEPTKWARQAIKNIAPTLNSEIARTYKLIVEGYTDNKRFKESDSIDNMTLSALRADSIRHTLKEFGIEIERVEGIRGMGNDGSDKTGRKTKLLVKIGT